MQLNQWWNEKMKNNIYDVSIFESKCTGCGACASSCKEKAITIEPRNGYFLFPTIDDNKCTNCGLCRRTCPCLNNQNNNEKSFPIGYGCYALDEEDRSLSTSGGAFSVLADYVFSKGGVVCGAAFTDGHTVRHVFARNKTELRKMHGSKYVQSFIGDSFIRAKEYLHDNCVVLFSGTPCQIAGLKGYLGKEYENLITVDLFCHGVPPQKLFDDYLNELTSNKLDSVKNFQFRNKKISGWKNFSISFEYSEGKYCVPGNEDVYFQGFRDCLTLRKSCTNCKFSRLPRQGDFTIGDFLALARRELGIVDDKGVSTFIINNSKAAKILEKIRDKFALLQEVDISKIKAKNLLTSHSYPHINSHRFRKALNEGKGVYPISLINEYLRKSDNIAIVNFHDSHNNYGSVLTGYALQEKIKQMSGLLPVHIPFAPSDWGGENGGLHPDISDLIDFCHEYIDETSPCYNELKLDELNKYVQTFITGPDGVWRNMGFVKDFYVYLLNFAHFGKNISSYAPSFGLNRIVNTSLGDSTEQIPSMFDLQERKRLLKRFNHISVREKSGVELCKKYFDVDAEHVLDAVFLLDANDYLKLSENSRLEVPKEFFAKYIINQSCVDKEIIDYINNMPGVYPLYEGCDHIDFIKSKNLSSWKYRGPKMIDWIKLMSKSSFVITDSFHGLCFAIIFKKQFVLTNVTFAGCERHKSLLDILGIKDNRFAKTVSDIKEILNRKIDYDEVYKHLAQEKEKSENFLREIINDNKPNKVKEWLESLEIEISQLKRF